MWPSEDAAASAWTAQVMELGALVCRARTPECSRCPVEAWCAWRDAGSPVREQPLARQRYVGTDRQARGRILDLLRETSSPQPLERVIAAGRLPQAADDSQARRALLALERDHLVTIEGERVSLPR
ncbi:hypothetical protein [Nanchangia anserum]|uniref:hypothetical protein n=1 Tax=Nanchangia anserum TaxID=2692125 RepID=UPI001D0FDD81|nr:hypothetical protein [Nanchangia anserum]